MPFFVFFRQPKNFENGLTTHRGCSTKWSIPQYEVPLISSFFIASNLQKPFTTLWGFCPLIRTPFSNFVRMRTRSLVPRPKTTVNGLETRLVHEMAGGQYWAVRMAGTVFSPPALGKAYEHRVGKALPTCSYTNNSLLTPLVNFKARMVSCQYDSLLCCSWSVVMTTESWN